MIRNLKNKLLSGSERTVLIKKNIMASALLRGVSILISLMVVPATINYINAEQYGIWLTLSSIIAWLSYFDFGFAHGFRNRFAEAVAKGEHVLARKYVSTTYAVLTLLFATFMFFTSLVNNYVNWSNILNVSTSLNNELRIVFQLLIIIFCINIVAEIFSTMLIANQRPAGATAIKTVGNMISLVTIILLKHTTTGNLLWLVLAYSAIPCCLTLLISFFSFKYSKYKKYSPSFDHIDLTLTRKLIGMGGKFFIIMVSLLIIFQFINIIISRELGPSSVTLYNVTYKLFLTSEMAVMIIVAPVWSAYTDAYTRRDYVWMKRCTHKLERIGLFCLPVLMLLILFSPYIFNLWIGETITTSITISTAVATMIFFKIMANIYTYQINGTGKIYIQFIVYLIFAIIALPLMIFLCRLYGIIGVVLVPTVTFLFQFIFCRIQIHKILHNEATGIWNK